MDEKEILWRQYEKEVDVYTFYLDLLLKMSLAVLGIAGAVATYVLTEADRWIHVLGLFVPVIMTGGFALLLWLSVKPARNMHVQHWKTAKMVSDRAGFDLNALPRIIQLMSLLLTVVCIGLCILGTYVLVSEYLSPGSVLAGPPNKPTE